MFLARDLRPMLATSPDASPSLVDPRAVYEPKYDGIRAIVLIEPGPPPLVRLWSRNGNEKSTQFPELVAALSTWAAGLDGPVVLDGEIVAVDGRGHAAGFQRLQGRINVSVPGYRSSAPSQTPEEQPAAFIAFDLLRDGDTDLRARPLTERRAALEARCRDMGSPLLRLSEQAIGDGRDLYARADRGGWEGLVVKRAAGPYRAGKRSPEWQKLKIQLQDEFVVGGWTEPRGARRHLGALILGTARPDGTLAYVGDVGTGFPEVELERLAALLDTLATEICPFDTPPKAVGTAHWVTPRLVAVVRYTEMTDEGRLRHPTYLGLRDDKAAGAVKLPQSRRTAHPLRTRQAPPVVATAAPAPAKAPRRRRRVEDPLAAWAPDAELIVAQLDDLQKRKKNGKIALPDGETLDVTNLGKVFWPTGRRTKGDLLRYYTRIAPLLLPVIAGRPLVMKRLPNGVDGQSFYQHRAPEPVPAGVRVETLPDDDVPARLVGGSLTTLLYMAQLASISMDPFFSTVDALHTPDQVAIDLDPQPGATFQRILDVARWVHEILERVGIAAIPKTSGSEGLHIFVPLAAGTPYQAGLLFCQIVATMVATAHPTVATVERTVSKRKPGTIYVDYLQNIEGKTLACAYSARASAFAGVSTPLTWAEVHGHVRPEMFTIDTVLPRVREFGDLWAGTRKHEGADLLGALEKLR
ncbi:MAG: DNA ligase D [Acidobacteria bacterium]|nr:DNA ligase D [Acidobacteriota bacterium]